VETEECDERAGPKPLFWGALIAGLLILCILPSLIGAIRMVEGLGWLVVVNLIPTGVGWLSAMVLAFMLPHREPSMAYPPACYTQARASAGDSDAQS
jgi:hypothetical protein